MAVCPTCLTFVSAFLPKHQSKVRVTTGRWEPGLSLSLAPLAPHLPYFSCLLHLGAAGSRLGLGANDGRLPQQHAHVCVWEVQHSRPMGRETCRFFRCLLNADASFGGGVTMLRLALLRNYNVKITVICDKTGRMWRVNYSEIGKFSRLQF